MELWDPFEQALSLRAAMDRLLQDSFVRPSGGPQARGSQGMNLPLDVHENEDAYTVRASLPGVKPEDVQIQITGDMVTIRGQTQEDHEEKRGEQVILHERRSGVFTRSFTLPAPVDADQAEATIENGELTLRLPKAQQARPRRIEVRGASGRQSISAQSEGATTQPGQSSASSGQNTPSGQTTQQSH